MPSMQMRISFEFLSDSDPEEVFDSVADALFDQAASSEDLFDADVTASLGDSKISLAIIGTGVSLEAASANASSAIRSAIHKSGGATPGWDDTVEGVRNQAVFKFLEQTAIPA